MKNFQFSVFNFQKISSVILNLFQDPMGFRMAQKTSGMTIRGQQGFTFVEAILYVSIISILLTTLIPFTWNIVEGQRKSATQEEVSSQARMISERIKYEIRNAVSINSVGASSLVLCEGSPCSGNNLTTISLSGGQISIAPAPAPTPVILTSNDVTVSSLTFTNNSSTTTKNVSFSLTLQQAGTQKRNEFKQSETIQSSVELRNL